MIYPSGNELADTSGLPNSKLSSALLHEIEKFIHKFWKFIELRTIRMMTPNMA